MALRKKIAGAALAGALGLTGVGLGTVATAAPAEAATCCYKIPNGTWGGYVRSTDVHLYWRDRNNEVRRKTDIYWRMVDGRWQERVQYVTLYVVRHGV